MKKMWTKVLGLLLAVQFLVAGCGGAQQKQTAKKAEQPVKAPAQAATLKKSVQGPLKITVIDVGKADSILIQLDGKNYLVDSGWQADGNSLVAKLRKLGVKSLNGAFLTHPHKDHIGGMIAVLNNFHVDRLYYTNVKNPESGLMNKVMKLVKDKKIPTTLVVAPMDIPLKDGASFKVFWPQKTHIKVPGDTNINPNSMVMRFTYKNFTMMFTGDAYKESEAQIISLYPAKELRSDVLKVGHHSSNTSTSTEWLKAVKPMVAVISCGNKPGENKYPNKTTLKRLKTAGIKIYNTYTNGNITITSDGDGYAVKGEK